MRIDLNKINDLSLLNIFFHNKKKLNYKEFEFLNLVFSREGAFIAIKSNFGIVFDKTELPYKNKGLNSLFGDEDIIYSFESFIPKPDISVLEEILEYFKYVCNKTKEELLVIVYYDTQNDNFITEIVKTQIVSGGSVEYAYNRRYEMDSRYVKYLEIHSHHSMGASFSGTDNNDESNRTLYFCGVLGKIHPYTSNIFNIDHKFRIWSGLRFIEIPIYEVFETHTAQPDLSDEKKEELDNLIKVSNAIKQATQAKNQTRIAPVRSGVGIPELPFFMEDRPGDGFYSLFQSEAVRSALEEMGIDPDDQDALDTLSEEELDKLPIEWEKDGKDLLERRGLN